MSRLGMAIFFLIAMMTLKDLTANQEKHKNLSWKPWLALIVSLMALEPMHAYLSGPMLHPIRYAMEVVSLTLFGLALIPLFKRYRKSSLFWHIFVAILLFIQSCVIFIIAKPFEHVWWFSHIVFSGGFIILGMGDHVQRRSRPKRSL